jgi:fructose-1,6-bisphosphatase I
MTESATLVVRSVANAVASVALEIEPQLPTSRGATSESNPSGDAQLTADVTADEQLAETLTALKAVGTYLSEERETAIGSAGRFTVAVDPLDGSKNIRSANCAGIIVGIYEGDLPLSGQEMVGATTVIFGSMTLQTTAVAGTVSRRALSMEGYETLNTSVQLPDDPTVYGIGGRRGDRREDVDQYVDNISEEVKCRYGGAMVADVQQVLSFGGVYGYPTVGGYPNGKLRGLVEVVPMAYIVETAGGASTVGTKSALEVPFEVCHDRTPVLMGNQSLVERAPDEL